MGKLTFILGGARSGKSSFAEQLLKNYCKVAYIATAEISDEEMARRIEVHRRSRPSDWVTVESPLQVDKAISEVAEEVDAVLVDCITLYVTNLLLDEQSPGDKQSYILGEIEKLCAICKEVSLDIFLVSNEVGMSIVPDNKLGRQFRDIAGWANQKIAKSADEVYFVVAGIAQRIFPDNRSQR